MEHKSSTLRLKWPLVRVSFGCTPFHQRRLFYSFCGKGFCGRTTLTIFLHVVLEITCPSLDLQLPENVVKSNCDDGDQFAFGSVCELSCATGYRPLGTVLSTCTSDAHDNGVWSPPNLNCSGKMRLNVSLKKVNTITPSPQPPKTKHFEVTIQICV